MVGGGSGKCGDFLKVDELPVSGTGKINLREIKRIAQEHFESSS